MTRTYKAPGIFVPTRLGADGRPDQGYVALHKTHFGGLEPLAGKNKGKQLAKQTKER